MRIGLLIGLYDSSYTLSIIKCLNEELRERKISLIVFEGFSLRNNTISDYQCNTIYRLISSQRIDGLIVLSSPLVAHTSKEMLNDLVLRLGLPAVSLGYDLEGFPSVVMENFSGFEKLVSHLISHNYKKFALISGPLANHESMQRRDAFMKVIYKNGLEVPGNFILEGNFQFPSGYNLTKKLIPFIKNGEIEVIVSANDEMAFGAIKCLGENGLSIPDDVAVTGFDDSGLSQNLLFPITTVSQPFEEMCRKAVSLLMNMKYGKIDTQVYSFEPHLAIRGSCGCKEDPQARRAAFNPSLFSKSNITGRLQALDTESFYSVLSDYLSENNITYCYIARSMEAARLDDFRAMKQDLRCKLFYGFSNGKRVYHAKPFEALQILPESIYETIEGDILIKHLYCGKIQFGYIVLPVTEYASAFTHDLGIEIGKYLESSYLTEEIQLAEKKLSDTMESLILTNRRLNEMTVRENLDKMNNIKYLAKHMMESRKVGNGDYCLIIVEIDNFLEINNRYGFADGEALMGEVSRVLAGSIRDDDFLSHQNCDRYVMLVKNAQSKTIEAIEKRFAEKLDEINRKHKRPYKVSFTWGYALARFDSDFDRVLAEAETNLASKKNQGGE
jgi:diguanylate cyclase (GGDEF)-like protein